MLGNFFKREINNNTFLLELLRDEFNESWLLEALKDEMVDINHKDEENNTVLMICLKESIQKNSSSPFMCSFLTGKCFCSPRTYLTGIFGSKLSGV